MARSKLIPVQVYLPPDLFRFYSEKAVRECNTISRVIRQVLTSSAPQSKGPTKIERTRAERDHQKSIEQAKFYREPDGAYRFNERGVRLTWDDALNEIRRELRRPGVDMTAELAQMNMIEGWQADRLAELGLTLEDLVEYDEEEACDEN